MSWGEGEVMALYQRTTDVARVADGDTFVRHVSDEETATVLAAVKDLEDERFKGARAHYKAAMEALTGGDYSGSMRESIHAVESVTKLLTGEKTLQEGVVKLGKQKHLHVTI